MISRSIIHCSPSGIQVRRALLNCSEPTQSQPERPQILLRRPAHHPFGSLRRADRQASLTPGISAHGVGHTSLSDTLADSPDTRDLSKPAQRIGRLPLALAIAGLSLLVIASPSQAAAAAAGRRSGIVGAFQGLLSFVLHLDVHLSQIIAKHGSATYAILFAIVFCETGLVVTPFLPGDSLLFAAGAFASLGHLNVMALLATFVSSAILGDALNYQLGKVFGVRATNSRLVKKEYIEKTEAFYLKHGGKTVVLARFIPIVRTFAPFVAGVGTMPYGKFAAYNVGGAVLWTTLFVGAGALLGNLPAVKHNFSIVVFAIVGVSLLPLLFEVAAAKREAKVAQATQQGRTVGDKAAAVEETRPSEGGFA